MKKDLLKFKRYINMYKSICGVIKESDVLKIVKFYKATIGNSKKEGTPGEIINIYKDGIGVKTNDGEIVLKEIKPEGKKCMEVSAFLNGINKDELIGKVFVKE